METREFKQTQAQCVVMSRFLSEMDLANFIRELKGQQAACPQAVSYEARQLLAVAEVLNQAREQIRQIYGIPA